MAAIPDPRVLEGRKEGQAPAPQSRDFFWDSITLYVVAVILALTAIDVVTEFVRGSKVQCYLPNETDSKLLARVQDYVNEFCTGHLPTLQYLSAFIAVHAIAIYVPHYAWLNAYGADLDFFFIHVSKLVRSRETATGDYPRINYTISKQLEEVFSTFTRSNGMYWYFIVKLTSQIALCVVGFILAPVIFEQEEQHISFECPENGTYTKEDSWPLPAYETVTCVFSPVRLLQKVWGVYLFLLTLAVLCLLINLIQLVRWHPQELGIDNCAEFSFQTGMHYHHYKPHIFTIVVRKNLCSPSIQLCTDQSPKSTVNALKHIKKRSIACYFPFSPYSIRSNYDFLMVKLFRTDGGLAFILKDVHIQRILETKNSSDILKMHLYRTPSGGRKSKEFLRDDIGWQLPAHMEQHEPISDRRSLILPPTVSGVLLGFAKRCVGSRPSTRELNNIAEQCNSLATKLVQLAERPQIKEMMTTLQQRANNLSGLVNAHNVMRHDVVEDLDSLNKKLTETEQKIHLTAQRMKDEVELELIAHRLKERVERCDVRAGDADVEADEGQECNVRADQDQNGPGDPDVEAEGPDSDDNLSTNQLKERVSRRLSAQQRSLNLAIKTTTNLQRELKNLRRQKDRRKTQVLELKDESSRLHSQLRALEQELQHVLNEQQQHFFELPNREMKLLEALKLYGPSVCALVIGFDMESQGFPTALARIFSRVGFINFSSHYADYENPLQVLTNSVYMFCATAPVDITTSDGVVSRKLRLDLKDKRTAIELSTMSEKFFNDLNEVWQSGYIKKKTQDVIHQEQIKDAGGNPDEYVTMADKLELRESNYVVVGPVSSHLHISTVDKVLENKEKCLSSRAVILTVKPIRVGGKTMKFKEYVPLEETFTEITPLNMKLGKFDDPWLWPDVGPSQECKNTNTFRIDVEDTAVELCFKLYRRN